MDHDAPATTPAVALGIADLVRTIGGAVLPLGRTRSARMSATSRAIEGRTKLTRSSQES